VGPQVLLPPGAGLVLEQVQLRGQVVHLFLRRRAAGATCPVCACWSDAFHSGYDRSMADLPIADRKAVIHLRVRRFRCHEQTCSRRTFVEQVPLLVERYARRTQRLRADLEAIGLVLGGRPGSRLSVRQKKPTSRSTLLRLVRALPDPPIESPRALGVDEFAFRRGRRYGTILVDASEHNVIDLLEDPSAEALVGWLSEHPDAEVICRDRDGVYASAATRGAPGAIQVRVEPDRDRVSRERIAEPVARRRPTLIDDAHDFMMWSIAPRPCAERRLERWIEPLLGRQPPLQQRQVNTPECSCSLDNGQRTERYACAALVHGQDQGAHGTRMQGMRPL
jgi:hypothetical protein